MSLKQRVAGSLGAATLLVAVLPGATASASPPGRNGLLAFMRSGNIFTATLAGKNVKQLTHLGGTSHPRWSPDGKTITFSQADYVWTMNADGTHQRKLFRGNHPSWSPNGKSILFNDDSGSPSSIVTRVLATGATTLIDTYGDSGECPYSYAPGPSSSYLPDAKTVIYGLVQTGGNDPQCGHIPSSTAVVRMPIPPKTSAHPLTSWNVAASAPDVDSAPSGTQVVFCTSAGFKDGQPALYLSNSQSGGRKQLTAARNVAAPVFSADGTSVLYGQRLNGTWSIMRVTLSTRTTTLVLSSASEPSVQPVH